MENLIIINVPNNLNSKSDFKIGFNVSFHIQRPFDDFSNLLPVSVPTRRPPVIII